MLSKKHDDSLMSRLLLAPESTTPARSGKHFFQGIHHGSKTQRQPVGAKATKFQC